MRRPLIALLAALASPLAAAADPVRASLSWVRADGASTCPDAAALHAAVTRRLGYDPTVTDAPPAVSVEVVVTRSGALPWQAALYLRDPAGALLGERHLDVVADTCTPLVDAVALAVAASLDGDALARTAAAPPPPPPPPPVVDAVPPPARRPTRRHGRRRWAVAASALGGVTVGALPSAAPMLSLVVEVRPPSWPTLVVTGLYQPDASVDLTTGRASLRLGLAGLAVCPWRGAAATVSLTLCAGALAGVLVAAGQGLAVDRIEERPYAALEAGARARWSLGSVVHLMADVQAVVPLIRDTLVVEGAGEVYRVSPIGLRAGIGVGVHFE